MGILDSLFGRPDPTQSWVAVPGVGIELDLDEHMLCGARLGDPIDKVSHLGPPDNRKATKDTCCIYKSRGFHVGFENGVIDWFQLAFRKEDNLTEYDSFDGACRYRGECVTLSKDTTIEEFLARFGEPWWRSDEDDETILFYEFGTIREWQVEFNDNGLLKAFLIVSVPLMDSAKQRELYKVDKPWPPRG